MRKVRLGWAAWCLGAVLASAALPEAAVAQLGAGRAAAPPSGSAQSGTPAGHYESIRQELMNLHRSGEALMKEYRESTDPKRKAEIEKQFDAFEQSREKLVPALLKAAEAAYVADPAKNEEAGRMLLQAATEHLQFGAFAEARRLGLLLQQNRFPEPQLPGLTALASLYLDDLATADQLFTACAQSKNLPEELAPYARECKVRLTEQKADDLPRVVLKTSKGEVVIELYENEAPNTVANFVGLVEKGFYKNVPFHRVLEDFMAQGGDPKGDGTGGPGYTIACECGRPDYRIHLRGTLSMAHAGKDSGGSQFFITYRPTPHLDGKHTVFGRVLQGMEIVDKFQRVDPNAPQRDQQPDRIVEAVVIRKRNHPYSPKISAVQNLPMRR